MSRREDYFEGATLTPEDLGYQREGLPEDYRMRHANHYVDEIIAATSIPQLRLVPVGEIEGSVAETRGESLDGLIDSIQAYGVLQPLLVRRLRGRYELLAGSKRLAAAVDAGLKEVPCLIHEVDDVEARRLAEAANRRADRTDRTDRTSGGALRWSPNATSLVANSLETILSTLGLFERPDSSLRDRVAVGLIRAEALKANRLLRGLEILRSEPPLTRALTDAATILRRVLEASDDERGLFRIGLTSSIPSSCPLEADEDLLSVAFAGAVETILALMRSSQGGTLAVEMAINEPARAINVTVSEDTVRMPTASFSHWFDLDWEERPGGFAAAVSLLAAKRAIELHHGRLDLAPTVAGGCRVTLMLPTDAS